MLPNVFNRYHVLITIGFCKKRRIFQTANHKNSEIPLTFISKSLNCMSLTSHKYTLQNNQHKAFEKQQLIRAHLNLIVTVMLLDIQKEGRSYITMGKRKITNRKKSNENNYRTLRDWKTIKKLISISMSDFCMGFEKLNS
ncbi:CLUMA_CG019823, isoform A [Clunio marinus]|uniref:CLUMA_CG019823, isoform A n=1 Tax=Clunio marinus TaxID=568069 RepID=A0A1J1J262_9DIPT|nr:CLUMA_CG019823, isoform A [Clunio marinus]